VFRILTRDAETISAPAQDSAFWKFITDLCAEVEALRAFDAGLQNAFSNWNPAQPASGAIFRTAVLQLTVPSSTPPAPTTLNGKIR
jgi:hypothetical protein